MACAASVTGTRPLSSIDPNSNSNGCNRIGPVGYLIPCSAAFGAPDFHSCTMIFVFPTAPTRAACHERASVLGPVLLAALILVAPLRADEAAVQSFSISAGDAETALKEFAAQSGWQVLAPTELINRVRTREVRGQFTAQAALDRMLTDTPLAAVADEASNAFALVRRPREPRNVPPLNAAAVIVIGLAVDEAQAQRFLRDAETVRRGLVNRGVPQAAITLVPSAPDTLPRRDSVLDALHAVPRTIGECWLVVLGKAAPGRDGAPMFQVSGPRLSAADLATAVGELPGKKFVVLGMAKSGGFLPPLLAVEDVEAVAATAEVGEINEPRFVAMWGDALDANPDASFRELALDAANRVATYYREQSLAQGEHAQLLDRAAVKIVAVPSSEAP